MKQFTIEELALLTHSKIIGHAQHVICGVEELDLATSSDASFVENPRYQAKMKHSAAGVIFIHPDTPQMEGRNYLLHQNPSLAFQIVIEAFLPKVESGFSSIHPSAIIHEEAILEEGVTIAPHAIIDRKVRIGKGSVIGGGVFIGAQTKIGTHCQIHPGAIIHENCELGDRVIVQSCAVIGSCGFGYSTDRNGKHHILKHLGKVVLEDDVEVGANTTIDRARFKVTRIGQGTKIDNLVQIAHQVDIGKDCLIVSQVGIAGSTKIGDQCVFGGQAGIVGHITIGSKVMFAARTGVSKSILAPGIYAGAPAMPVKEHHENAVLLKDMKSFAKKIKMLEEKIKLSSKEGS